MEQALNVNKKQAEVEGRRRKKAALVFSCLLTTPAFSNCNSEPGSPNWLLLLQLDAGPPGHPLLYKADQSSTTELTVPCRAAGVAGTQCSWAGRVYPAPAASPPKQLQLSYSFLSHQTHCCQLTFHSLVETFEGKQDSCLQKEIGLTYTEITWTLWAIRTLAHW